LLENDLDVYESAAREMKLADLSQTGPSARRNKSELNVQITSTRIPAADVRNTPSDIRVFSFEGIELGRGDAHRPQFFGRQ
jgi:hypothetical protein